MCIFSENVSINYIFLAKFTIKSLFLTLFTKRKHIVIHEYVFIVVKVLKKMVIFSIYHLIYRNCFHHLSFLFSLLFKFTMDTRQTNNSFTIKIPAKAKFLNAMIPMPIIYPTDKIIILLSVF